MNDRIKALVSEILSMEEEARKEFELTLRTEKKEITATKKAVQKEEKKANKEANHAAGIAKVNELGIGREIEVTYKDGNITGVITKIGEKTFTICVISEEDGEDKNIFRYYHQVV